MNIFEQMMTAQKIVNDNVAAMNDNLAVVNAKLDHILNIIEPKASGADAEEKQVGSPT